MKLLAVAVVAVVLISVTQGIRHARCWTKWFDSDDPSGTGDWELLSSLRSRNRGQICSRPSAIQAQSLNGQSPAAAKDTHLDLHPLVGFWCVNAFQADKHCNDYRVRFLCPCHVKVCWSQWFDRDDPGGPGDYETLVQLRQAHPGKICANPGFIQGRAKHNRRPALRSGRRIRTLNPRIGLICRNSDQGRRWWIFGRRKRCYDYEVRFGCRCLGVNPR